MRRPPDDDGSLTGHQIGLPATEAKCKWLKNHMNLIARGSGSVNWRLWRAWLNGKDAPDLDFGDFDTSGECLESLIQAATDKWKDTALAEATYLSCGQRHLLGRDSFINDCQSGNEMITWYTMRIDVEIGLHKKCDENGCCQELVARMWWTAEANDETDFNDGEWFSGGAGLEIADALVNECNRKYWKTAKDFFIKASDQGGEVWRAPCSGK